MMIKKIKLRKFQDERGSLVENSLPEIMNDTKHFFVSKSKPGIVRGNHYHLRKLEWFYVIQGRCKFVVEDIKTKKREELIVDSQDNVAVNVGKNVSHAFENIGDEEMVLLALINEVFDENDADTYSYKVI